MLGNNINYHLNSFTFDQLVRNFKQKAGLPVDPFDESLHVFWFKQLQGSEAGRFDTGMVGVKAKKNDIGVKATPESIKKMLHPVPGKPLHFSIEGNTQFEYWPYFEIQDEPFSCFPEFFR